jgi:hypothetical protein
MEFIGLKMRPHEQSEKGNDVVRFFCPKCGWYVHFCQLGKLFDSRKESPFTSAMASTTSGGPGTIAVFAGPFAELRNFDYFIEFATRSRSVLGSNLYCRQLCSLISLSLSYKHMRDLPDATHLWGV